MTLISAVFYSAADSTRQKKQINVTVFTYLA